MQYEASFDEKALVSWQEKQSRTPDLRHLQGAMFMDRPDLWPVRKPRAKAGSRPLPGQTEFKINEEGDN